MDENLKDLDLSFSYIDYILVYSPSPQDHDLLLRILLTELQN